MTTLVSSACIRIIRCSCREGQIDPAGPPSIPAISCKRRWDDMAKKKVSTGLIPDLHRKRALEIAIRGEYEVADADVFLKACQSNPGYATLTPYTVEQLADSSVFRIWKLKGMELYYGLRIEGPSVELIEVIRNDPELPGVATGSAILHAIEQGVTCLTAFDLNDFLTKRYERYGFVPCHIYPFDPHYTEDGEYPWLDESGKGPSQRLKLAEAYWRKSGWSPQRKGKFATNYPGVREMKLEATEKERAVARSVYHSHFIKRRVEDLEKVGIKNPISLLKQYGFETTDEQFINESRLLTVLTKTAEADHTFENMIRFDTSEPMIKVARENVMRHKIQRAMREFGKDKLE